MAPFLVVLDACVILPAALRDTLLGAGQAGLYQLHWTEAILEEVRRNLVQNRGVTEQKAPRLIATLREVFPEAMVTGYEPLIPAMTNDEKDRHVLAAAVACRAQVIVTSNLRDFPLGSLEPYHVEAQSPDGFLTNLYDLAPATMVRVVDEQAAVLRNPPLTVDAVLAQFARQAPDFAQLIRTARSRA